MSTDPRTAIPDAKHIAGLWTGLLLAPASFLLSLALAYALVPRSCLRNDTLLVHAAQLLCLLLAIGGWVVAWRLWREAGPEWPHGEQGGPVGRTRFMAGLGFIVSAFFTLVLLAQWIPGFVLSPCQ
ncbi:MAG TPA: hypothetical protein VF046_06235 [Gemmatimonadales bacterium]